jgi:hypothetical protein
MISDARLISLFTGSNRPYMLVLDDGSVHMYRARDMRDAKKIAREFVSRLTDERTIVSITKEPSNDLGN